MTLPPLPLLPEAASDEYSLWVPYEGAQTIHRDVYTDEQMESYATTYAEQRQSASGAQPCADR